MTERDSCRDASRGTEAADFAPGGMSRAGRRSGVASLDPESGFPEGIRGTPRRSSIIKDLSVHKMGGRKKTVSFSSTPSERKVSSAADCLAFMQCGCELRKVRPNSRIYYRFYTLDPSLTCLRWEPSKKDSDRARLDISAICEVRAGKCTETFCHSGTAECLAEEASFSIIHGDGYQSLDLVALSPEVANIWVTGLRYLISHPGSVRGSVDEGSLGNRLRRSWLAAEFGKDDENGCGVASEDAAVAAICRLCPSIRETKVRLRFKEIQRIKEKLTSHVTLEEFQEVYCELCTRPDVYFLLVQLAQDRECLDAQALRGFLETEQGLRSATAEGCLDIVQHFEPSAWGREQGLLSLDGFARYLQSPECQLFDPKHQHVCQDMSQPLTHYFIKSSSCSYLSEELGCADLGAMQSALQAGCRCLELTVTDGPSGEAVLAVETSLSLNDPSQAPTVPITARAALEIIDKYGFASSPYPLLLCLCQRCSPNQQRVLADHLRKVFSSRLYTLGAQEAPPGPEDRPQLPSPEELKGRVLLVGKKRPSEGESSDGDASEEEEELEDGGELTDQQMAPKAPHPLRSRICEELSELLVMSRSSSRCFYRRRACQNESPLAPPNTLMPQAPPCWTVCSMGEDEAAQLVGESTEELVDFTERVLVWVCPSAEPSDSSNADPQDFWKAGCQLVALNLQMPGTVLDVHRAHFAKNGGCGYVLQPAAVRGPDRTPASLGRTLRVRVISAHGLPKPQGSGAKGDIIDPYVVLELHGVSDDCAEERTGTGAQNQDDPLFDETFEFQVSVPELAVLRFVVLDDDYITDDFIGQYSVSFECLQPGFRTVPLLGLTGQLVPHASLFIHVVIAELKVSGKPHKQARRGHGSVALHSVGVRALDDTFRSASAPLGEATDLRVSAQSAVVAFKEHFGLPLEVTFKQCIQSLVPLLQAPDGSLGASLVLKDGYPCLEVLGNSSESVQKLEGSYSTMISAQRRLIENADRVQEEIKQVSKEGMELHENLSRLGEKEELKGRKQSKALESSAWNITALKGQCDLICSAKADALDALRELVLAFEACGLMANAEDARHASS
ncbi:inactive phospholipase C-like protein 1 [Brienomyrus brachyistius]|uniref:inactive phospholipase C-like protein 1 n=1 Tax=Brienomyrus brachyistius TaxID=42636 RepID=UPI0020B3A5E4|nr:inactive phospholipase C-like protein 1 [Brienomyrus brachyistius]